MHDQILDGAVSAVRLSMSGTHLGPYAGMPPTGRRFDTTQLILGRLEDGRFVEIYQEIDALRLLDQLGAVPPLDRTPLAFLGWTLKTLGRFAYLGLKRRIS